MLKKNKETVCVVVPIYKEFMDQDENISLFQCVKILSNHAIILVAPDNLNISEYLKICDNAKVIRFNKLFFENIDGYNKLLLSKKFYKSFIDFKYILIHQLDAFVFKDELANWCKLNFDYIGAPFINKAWNQQIAANFSKTYMKKYLPFLYSDLNIAIGNGGFSLRKIKSFLFMLSIFNKKAKQWSMNEDIFWSFYISGQNPFFRIPDFDTALRFAFESDPSKCFLMNKKQLPFGCHGWNKNEKDFWKPKFKELGYEI